MKVIAEGVRVMILYITPESKAFVQECLVSADTESEIEITKQVLVNSLPKTATKYFFRLFDYKKVEVEYADYRSGSDTEIVDIVEAIPNKL